MTVLIHHHAATGIVRSWYDWNRFFGHINAQVHQARVNGREVLGDKVRWFMTDVEIHAVCTQAFHFEVDGTSNNIAGGEVLYAHQNLA